MFESIKETYEFNNDETLEMSYALEILKVMLLNEKMGYSSEARVVDYMVTQAIAAANRIVKECGFETPVES